MEVKLIQNIERRNEATGEEKVNQTNNYDIGVDGGHYTYKL
jgi:hypothetical protein